MTGGAYRPSVTTILSQTESESSKKALATWIKNNPNNDAAGAAPRCTCCGQCLRDSPYCPRISDFWNGLSTYLDYFDNLQWSEGPLRPTGTTCVAGQAFASVWSTEHNFAGCPDLVAELGGVKASSTSRHPTPHTVIRSPIAATVKGLAVGENIKSFQQLLHTAQPFSTHRLCCDVNVVLSASDGSTNDCDRFRSHADFRRQIPEARSAIPPDAQR